MKSTWRCALAALTLALVLTACGGSESRKQAHMEKGREFVEAGNWDKARLEFKNALQIDEQDLAARFELAKVLEQLKDLRAAAGHYMRIVEIEPGHVQARVRLGHVLLLGGAQDLAQEQVDAALALAPEDPDVLALAGGLALARGQLEAAEGFGARALARDATHVNGIALMAALEMRRQQPAKAIALLEQGLAAHPEEDGLRSVLAGVLAEAGETAKAASLLEQAVARHPEQLGRRLLLAGLLARTDALDEAERVLREAVAALPDDPQAKLALVEFLASRRDRDQAERELRAMVEASPDAHALRFGLARLLEASARGEEAEAVYRQIIERDSEAASGLEARNLLALSLLRRGELDQADTLVAELVALNPKSKDALTTRGRLALLRNDPVSAINDFRSALREEPEGAELSRLLAQAHLMNQEPELARDVLGRAITAQPGAVELRVDLARALAAEGKLDEAAARYAEALEVKPGDVPALEGLFRVQAAKGDWEAALGTAETLQGAHPELAVGHHLAGVAHQARQRFEDSLPAFERALERAPDAADSLTQLVRSLLALREPERAAARLDQALAGNPGNFVALNLKAELLLAQGRGGAAIPLFEQAIGLSPRWTIPYRGLAAAHLQAKDVEAAVASYRRGLEVSPNDMTLVPDLATVLVLAQRPEEAIALYEAVLEDRPGLASAANNLAMLLAEYRGDTASLERAAGLTATLDGSNPAFLDTRGWIQYRRGELDLAVATLQQAVERLPGAGELRYHLGMVYQAKGDRERARQELDKAVTLGGFPALEQARNALDALEADSASEPDQG